MDAMDALIAEHMPWHGIMQRQQKACVQRAACGGLNEAGCVFQ
jgi:hypothetical protein